MKVIATLLALTLIMVFVETAQAVSNWIGGF